MVQMEQHFLSKHEKKKSLKIKRKKDYTWIIFLKFLYVISTLVNYKLGDGECLLN
jgi:hypothetical protein